MRLDAGIAFAVGLLAAGPASAVERDAGLPAALVLLAIGVVACAIGVAGWRAGKQR